MSCKKENLFDSGLGVKIDTGDALHHSGSGTYEFEIIPKNNFDEQWILEMATDMQDANDSLNFIGNLVQNYGIIRWNMASMYSSVNDYRKILVPIEKNDRVSAIIQGDKINGVYYFNVFTRDSILTLLSSNNITDREIATLAHLVATIINVDFLYFGRTNETLRNWISNIDQSNITNNNDVISRCEFPFTSHTKVWYQYGEGNTLEEFEIVSGYFILTLVECLDGAGGGFLGPVGTTVDRINPGHGVVNPLSGQGSPPASTNDRINDNLMDLLDEEEEECLKRNLSSDAMGELQKLFRSAAFSGCNEVSVNEIIKRIVEEICSNSNQNNYNPEDPLGSLVASVPFTNSDNIIEQINDSGANIMEFSTGCKFMQCVLKAMNQFLTDDTYPHHTKYYCNILDNFGGTKPVTVNISYQDFNIISGVDNEAMGVTTPKIDNEGRKVATIAFNVNRCNAQQNYLSAADSYLHEFYHATLYNMLVEDFGWNFNTSDVNLLNSKLDELSTALLNETFTNEKEHNIMIRLFMEEWEEILWSLNGKIGNKEVYKGLILNGIPTSVSIGAGHDPESLYNQYILNTNIYGPLASFVDNCL